MVHCALPPWRLVLLEGRVASEASYPAWPVTEKARPKVLVFFLRLWWMLLCIKGEPEELPIVFEACGTHATIENKLSRKKRWFKCKKDQDLRPSSTPPKLRQGSSLRSQPCPLKGPTAKAVVRSAPWPCSHEPT